MADIRYIQAADLHLDTPFQGLCRDSSHGKHLGKLLHEATFSALERLVKLCEIEKPDFLVIAGDIYNQEERSLKAQLKFRDACVELNQAGVEVFIVHGNHDPLSSRFSTIEWPENVTIFGPEVESREVRRDGRIIALVHGISHARDKEPRNLARMFRKDASHDCFQLGILHCDVDNAKSADRYAPCSLQDLLDSGLDAWALGHVHEKSILCQTPFIAYSGNTQGLHINEPGARGCFLVTARPAAGSWRCQAEFYNLAPVHWQKMTVCLDKIEKVNELEQKLDNQIEEMRLQADASITGLILRCRLEGRTVLDSMLRKKSSIEDMAERLAHFASGQPSVWIKDFEIDTHSFVSENEYLGREDILGEVTRVAQDLLEDGEKRDALARKALEPLFGHARLRKAIAPFDQEQIRRLLIEAERICQDLLEGR